MSFNISKPNRIKEKIWRARKKLDKIQNEYTKKPPISCKQHLKKTNKYAKKHFFRKETKDTNSFHNLSFDGVHHDLTAWCDKVINDIQLTVSTSAWAGWHWGLCTSALVGDCWPSEDSGTVGAAALPLSSALYFLDQPFCFTFFLRLTLPCFFPLYSTKTLWLQLLHQSRMGPQSNHWNTYPISKAI